MASAGARLVAKGARDVIIVGGGHNALVSAAYLAKSGLDVLVLERRHVLGGAAVTEEIVPGFKFSRASYLAGLLRPAIIEDLRLKEHGLKYLRRDPSSFTPTPVDGPYGGKSLLIQSDAAKTLASIAQFSSKDAETYPQYEEFLFKVCDMIQPLLDAPLPDPTQGGTDERVQALSTMNQLLKVGARNRHEIIPFYELFTAPAAHILNRWFESDVLKATLATDAVIGSIASPSQAGSAYVLLHHVMGSVDGVRGVWAYVEGGMGAVSGAIASAARSHGAELVTGATVQSIRYDANGATGVVVDGEFIPCKHAVLMGCNPHHGFLDLLGGSSFELLPSDFVRHIAHVDYSCGAMKINCAVRELPNFLCMPTDPSGQPGPQHRGTVHFETSMDEIEKAAREAQRGIPATRPVIEMTIPSSLDKTLAPEGQHVVQLFVQFIPYDLDPSVGSWKDGSLKNQIADRVFKIIDEHCPNFSSSVIGRDVLSPWDLEQIFGLHKGNIFHGALSLHQLGYTRPAPGYSSHRTPVRKLYLCGSGAHPGGGVMGAPGKNCAQILLSDLHMGKLGKRVPWKFFR